MVFNLYSWKPGRQESMLHTSKNILNITTFLKNPYLHTITQQNLKAQNYEAESAAKLLGHHPSKKS